MAVARASPPARGRGSPAEGQTGLAPFARFTERRQIITGTTNDACPSIAAAIHDEGGGAARTLRIAGICVHGRPLSVATPRFPASRKRNIAT